MVSFNWASRQCSGIYPVEYVWHPKACIYVNICDTRGTTILCKLKEYIDSKYLKQLYYSFIFPYMIYCVEIWGNTNKKYINQIIKTQKQILRIITNSKYNCSVDAFYTKLGILPFPKLVYQRIGIAMYKLHLGHMPQSVKDIFVDSNYNHSHNTRNKSHMRVDKQRHEFMSKTVYYQGIRFWKIMIV